MMISVSRAAPHRLQHLGHFVGRGIAHGQRHQGERVEHRLQKGQLHFQRVFLGVRVRTHDHLGQPSQGFDGGAIHGHLTQRGGESLDTRQCQPTHRHAVYRTEQHDATDRLAPWGELGVRLRGGRTGIDVASVGNDQGLGRRLSGILQWCKRLQKILHSPRQHRALSRIERAGDSCGTNLMHGDLLASRVRSIVLLHT
jgi:hypothetical protein